ncbi:hypothetical protein E2C01_071249 [Portunus trituberculatus]|uniref:Uncharacterized protein n=1 Tax=Portunus trituberculatus TaxID=210409 RepID=A0A5B7I7H2_PORTR|nr:hypothetical protein [Portunus trituberculatus]
MWQRWWWWCCWTLQCWRLWW